MITGWFAKLALTLALVGLVIFEAASPFVVRVQLDGTAVTAAQESRLEFERTSNADAARKVAEAEAKEGSAAVFAFSVDPDGGVTVVLQRRAKSFVVERIKRFRGYYDVTASATSKKS